ncbi:hypothetical protein HZH66_014363 [Vespula vulgaris]|uniref:Uncharacterized protein n=1 Tax=Vespula vulgaris TaxID=7454 RepID=A0A834J0J2_VESVU|nr:hypothetical protein HZH66_014363 [Vespula vulgaris]
MRAAPASSLEASTKARRRCRVRAVAEGGAGQGSTEGKRYPEGNALAEKRTPSRYERIPTCFDDIRSFAVGFSMEKEAA